MKLKKAPAQAPVAGDDQASANEPPEIQKLRLQVHQYGDVIAAAIRGQKRLQQEIAVYQGRVTLTPSVEENTSCWPGIMRTRRRITRICWRTRARPI